MAPCARRIQTWLGELGSFIGRPGVRIIATDAKRASFDKGVRDLIYNFGCGLQSDSEPRHAASYFTTFFFSCASFCSR